MASTIRDAVRYWEPRRIAYNAVLTALTLLWVARTWPHFQPAMTLANLGRLLVLAAIANVLYSTAYLADLPLQELFPHATRRAWRTPLFVLGTLLALLLTQYWIADEIYPYVTGGPEYSAQGAVRGEGTVRSPGEPVAR